jgi:hypothetical protein
MAYRVKHRSTVGVFFEATNAFDVDAALACFKARAIIEGPSVGETFVGSTGVREYLERFFVGYHTATRLWCFEAMEKDKARVCVDFTGDIGHEIGLLKMVFDCDGLIGRIDAGLE